MLMKLAPAAETWEGIAELSGITRYREHVTASVVSFAASVDRGGGRCDGRWQRIARATRGQPSAAVAAADFAAPLRKSTSGVPAPASVADPADKFNSAKELSDFLRIVRNQPITHRASRDTRKNLCCYSEKKTIVYTPRHGTFPSPGSQGGQEAHLAGAAYETIAPAA